jgi:hypothetical protein
MSAATNRTPLSLSVGRKAAIRERLHADGALGESG